MSYKPAQIRLSNRAGSFMIQRTTWDGDILYANDRDGTFTDVTLISGINNDIVGNFGAAWGDFNNDGFLDIYVVRADYGTNIQDVLYRNNGNNNNWLHVKTVEIVSNKAGIGTKITAVTSTLSQIREVSGGSGRASQNSLVIEFGLGACTNVDALIIRWPSGIIDIYTDININQCFTVLEDSGLVSVDQSPNQEANLVKSVILKQNYPNPFNPNTTIEYDLPKAAHVAINIYDILGRSIETLVNKKQPAGFHQIIWHAGDRTSGMYFFKIEAGDFTETRKMLLLK